MADPRFDVLGVGACAVDEIYRLPAWPSPDGPDKLRVTGHRQSPGGQTATVMAACAAAGLRAAWAGTLGNDARATLVREALEARGVDTSAALVREAPGAYAVILIDETRGERVVLWDRALGLGLRPGEIPDARLREARLVHVDDVDEEAAIDVAARARAAGRPVTSDIERVGARTRALVAAVSVPIFAEHVAEALTGEADPERACRALRRDHDGLLCVTRGARGAALLDGDTWHQAQAPEVTVVDTTGAGDVFRGAFIAALLASATPERILAVAVAAAAESCTREGAIPSVPTPATMRELLAP
jgi:sugar/nucleoside kinase (ribokinase family)